MTTNNKDDDDDDSINSEIAKNKYVCYLIKYNDISKGPK